MHKTIDSGIAQSHSIPKLPVIPAGGDTTKAPISFFFAMCLAFPALATTPVPENWMLGNPASSNCAANHNGSLFIQTDSKTGAQYGICQLSPTLAVEEWCLYRQDQNIEKKDCPNLIVLLGGPSK